MEIERSRVAADRGVSEPAKAKTLEAARQFEALMMEQLLRGMRSGEGWLGGGEGGADSIATEFAEQQLAGTLARHGGLGLATMIVTGLERSE